MKALAVSPHLDGFEIDGVRYSSDRHGVIHQDPGPSCAPYVYDRAYVESRYDSLPDHGRAMSLLRAGFLLGAIGYPQTVCDVGYGNGDFLAVMRLFGAQCFGYDVSGYPVPDGCKAVLATAVREAFELVTFFDSLEHCRDISFVAKLRARHVCISVPWRPSLDEFAAWKHRRPGEHLHHFDYDSLRGFMAAAGYRMLRACSIEDCIRSVGGAARPNILTAVFGRV